MKRKIKLRDLTEKQYKEWFYENCERFENCDECPFKKVQCSISAVCCWIKNKEIYTYNFLDQEVEIDMEAPKLTKDEKVILSSICDEWKYIARDDCGKLYLYDNKPIKYDDGVHYFGAASADDDCTPFPFDHLFEFIKFKDDEAYLISDLLKENNV